VLVQAILLVQAYSVLVKSSVLEQASVFFQASVFVTDNKKDTSSLLNVAICCKLLIRNVL